MTKITIIAKIKIKEEFINEIYPLMVKLHKDTHENDKGCLQYDLHTDINDKNSFVFIETWENNELLNIHMEKEHFKSFAKSIENKIENFEITHLEKI